MLKLLLVTFALSPLALAIAHTSMAGSIEEISSPYISYEQHAKSKLAKLEACQSVSIPMYFHEEYVETHSAAYLTEAVAAADRCEIQGVTVSRVITNEGSTNDRDLSEKRAEELSLFVHHYVSMDKVSQNTKITDDGTGLLNNLGAMVEFNLTPKDRTFSEMKSARTLTTTALSPMSDVDLTP